MNEPTLPERIECLEECYEFMLAYAAQGRERDDPSSAPGIRQMLEVADETLAGLAASGEAGALAVAAETRESYRAFVQVLAGDADRARRAVALVLAQPSIGSQLVDNLNGSIHLRAVLTDLFLLDEATKARSD